MFRRLRIIGAVGVAATLLLAGCSTLRLGYGQGPELAYWWLDGYVDFDEAQSPVVRDGLASWFAWHRRTQLPDYAALLQRARGELLAGPATAAQACRWADELRPRADVAVEQALPMLADVALSLSPAQIEHLARQYRRKNAELRDEILPRDPRQRRQAAVDRAVARYERVYGRLDAAQREVIARGVDASPFDAERWMARREARQRDVLQTLRRLQAERPSKPQAVEALRALAQRQQAPVDDADRADQRRLQEHHCAVAAAVHNATTPAQREAAAARLLGWENDARVLAGLPPAVAGTPVAALPAADGRRPGGVVAATP